MKILQHLPYLNPKRGGDVNVCFNISNCLAKMGHEVTIITTDFEFDKNYVKPLEKAGVNIIPFKCIANVGSFFYAPSTKKWAEKHIQKFDIIHMQIYRSYQNNVIYHSSKKYEIPYILQAHGAIMTLFQKSILKKFYDKIWGYKLLQNASKVIALTHTEVEHYKMMNIKRDRIETLPNGINLSFIKLLPEIGAFKRKYSIGDDNKIILYLGRINEIKGINLLIDAFEMLLRELKNVKLVIVGPDDGFLSNLKIQVNNLGIEEKVLFVGPLYEKEKLNAYVDADIYVLPSKYETFPNTVLESVACLTPVIVTDRCGIADLVDKNFGFVVEYNKEKLYEKMLKLLKNENLRLKFGENGKKLVKEDLNWIKISKNLEDIYKDSLNAK